MRLDSRNQAKFGIALKNIGTGMSFNGTEMILLLMGKIMNLHLK